MFDRSKNLVRVYVLLAITPRAVNTLVATYSLFDVLVKCETLCLHRLYLIARLLMPKIEHFFTEL